MKTQKQKTQKIAVEWIDEKRGPHYLDDPGYDDNRIKSYDPDHPPVIVVEYDDCYGIINGRHRVMAAKNNNIKKINAIILKPDQYYELEEKHHGDLDALEAELI